MPDRPGYFIEPAIVRDIEEAARLVDEEQFGPVLPVIKFSDPEEALARINRTDEGLGGQRVVAGCRCGTRPCGSHRCGHGLGQPARDLDPGIPFSGAKQSDVGTELGREGLEEFTQRRLINVSR